MHTGLHKVLTLTPYRNITPFVLQMYDAVQYLGMSYISRYACRHSGDYEFYFFFLFVNRYLHVQDLPGKVRPRRGITPAIYYVPQRTIISRGLYLQYLLLQFCFDVC